MGAMPSPWLFGRALIVSLIVFLPIYLGYQSTRAPNLIPGLIVVGSFALPITTLVLFFELNTPRNVSLTRVLYMFLVGAAASLMFSLFLSQASDLFRTFAPAAALAEEPAKLAA
jgi:RsiW-degrading membrane proteinase PrsW (M82 family)